MIFENTSGCLGHASCNVQLSYHRRHYVALPYKPYKVQRWTRATPTAQSWPTAESFYMRAYQWNSTGKRTPTTNDLVTCNLSQFRACHLSEFI